MNRYRIIEEVSGEAKVITAETPQQALVQYLKEDKPVINLASEWVWSFTVTKYLMKEAK